MIEITYLDASKNEELLTFESYDDFDHVHKLIGVWNTQSKIDLM